MAFTLNRSELSQYRPLRKQVKQIDENIREINDELAELDKYNMELNSVLSGMPNGNKKRDKIGDFIARLESDRIKLNAKLEFNIAERVAVMHRLYVIRSAVNSISNDELRNLIKWHFFDGQSADEIGKKNFMSRYAVQKRINRFLQDGE